VWFIKEVKKDEKKTNWDMKAPARWGLSQHLSSVKDGSQARESSDKHTL